MAKGVPPTSSASADAPAFEIIELPPHGPAHVAIALPGPSLRALPGFPAAALPESGRIASGRGLSRESCLRSALGEAAELASCCDWGDDRPLLATEAELGPDALSPAALNGFTADQLARRTAWNRRHGALDWRPRRRSAHEPLAWIAVADAYGGPGRYAPADFVRIGRRERGDRRAVAIGDSLGCAAGPTLPAAQLAAVLELIERDAAARWWYGCRRRPPLPLEAIDGAGALAGWLADRPRLSRLVDIGSDIAVPVLAAISAEPDGSDVALGFAARLERDAAAVAALTEMLQMELALAQARRLGDRAGSWAAWRRTVSMATPPLDAALAPARPSAAARPAGGGLGEALDACRRRGIDLWLQDATRPEIGMPVARALSTSLCHSKPRLARPRLTASGERDLKLLVADPALRPPLRI
jgi:ribosomal protein S12 methylthiotransferase accessory factor